MCCRILWIALFGMLWVGNCLSCLCSFPTVPNAVKKADLVFRGRLVNIEYLDKGPAPRRFLATVEVSEVWKGRVAHRIVLHTREGSSDCVGFSTEVGKEYLIFANVGRITPKEEGVFRIPEWTDKLPVGQQIVSPGVCTLSEQIDSGSTRTLQALGRSRPPSR
jgi:hypothetical protein